jgi:hypothetical protein
MTATAQSRSEHIIRWIIDADGSSYGDERDRQRYYEAHSAILTAIIYLTPFIASICVLSFGRKAVPATLVMGSIPLLPTLFAVKYLEREKVDLEGNLRKQSRTRTGTYFLLWFIVLPVSVFMTYRRGTPTNTQQVVSMAIGAAIGLSFAFVSLRRYTNRITSGDSE